MVCFGFGGCLLILSGLWCWFPAWFGVLGCDVVAWVIDCAGLVDCFVFVGWISLACGFPDGVCVLVVGWLFGFLVCAASVLGGLIVGSFWWCFCDLVLVRLFVVGFDLYFSLGWVYGILVGLLILMFALGW